MRRGLPTLMMPTTASTGSEATPNSIVLVLEDELKVGIMSPKLMPDSVIRDPKMTIGFGHHALFWHRSQVVGGKRCISRYPIAENRRNRRSTPYRPEERSSSCLTGALRCRRLNQAAPSFLADCCRK